jgi:predicted alpha/beta hydrolase family esterase
MDKKQQIIVIHGGSTFDSPEAYSSSLDSFVVNLERLRYQRDWKETLQKALGPSFDILLPRMPNNTNAQYADWKKIFEKIMEKVDENVVLVGHSLGALFLTKYLSENFPSKKVKSVFLIAAPFDDTSKESLGSFAIDVSKVGNIQEKVSSIFLYFSKDDPVVSFSEADKYAQKLPQATLRTLDDRGHFRQEQFPELVRDLQNLS